MRNVGCVGENEQMTADIFPKFPKFRVFLYKSRINAIQPEMKRSDRMAIRFNRAYVYYVEN